MPDSLAEFKGMNFPVIIEKGQDGYYVVRCAVFHGCLTQGKTIEEALVNIKEVIEMCLEEEECRELAREFKHKDAQLLMVNV